LVTDKSVADKSATDRSGGAALALAAASAVILGLAAMLRREMERGRRRRDELSVQESLLNTMLGVVPALIWVKDEEGRSVIVNDALANQTGMEKEAFIGRRAIDVLPPNELAKIQEWDKAAMAEPGVAVGGELKVLRRGETVYRLNTRRACMVGG